MAFIIDEQKLVEDNIFKFENRLNSQISRFLDKSPTFVTYFHLNVNETTLDGGFKDIEAIIGEGSPLKFQKIENFPIYGLEPVVLSIEDSEQGLDTNYSGDCIILPNTIKPLQNDFFMIKHVDECFLFRVTEIHYDNIRPDNYYQIGFRFEWLDKDKVDEINNQVDEKYSCILQNIGSENNCIIKEEYLDRLNEIDNLYTDIINTYKSIYYNDRYNCFLGEMYNGYKLYDPLQTVFFNKHKLLNKKQDYSTIILTEGFTDNKRKLKYERSIYRFFERRDIKLINQFNYHMFPGMFKKDSSFYRWSDQSIQVIDIPTLDDGSRENYFLSSEMINSFRLNAPTESKYVDLMQKFIRNESISIYEIPLDMNEELMRLNASVEVFLFTPILLYIIQTIVNDFLKEKE